VVRIMGPGPSLWENRVKEKPEKYEHPSLNLVGQLTRIEHGLKGIKKIGGKLCSQCRIKCFRHLRQVGGEVAHFRGHGPS